MSTDAQRKQSRIEIYKVIGEAIGDFRSTSDFVNNKEKMDKLVEQVKQLPEIHDKFSTQELNYELFTFLCTSDLYRPMGEGEAKGKIDKFLTWLAREKSYEAKIVLPGVLDLPIGTRIGPLEIVEQDKEGMNLGEHLKSFRHSRGEVHVEGQSQGKVVFKAYISFAVHDVLYKILELPFAILSLLLDLDMDVRDCAGTISSINCLDFPTTLSMLPHNLLRSWKEYRPHILGDYFERLSEISVEERPSRLKRKILQAIQVYGLSRLSHKAEVRFLFLTSSFESLLLTENDRDYLGMKMAEKTAFLLENNYQKRLELYKTMKDFYRKRSGIVHSGQKDISDSEVRTLDSLFRATAFRILELSNKYTKMEQRSHDEDKEGIEDYITELRFS